MKVKTRLILEMAIEQGVRRGWRLAHKHVEAPSEGAIQERIEEQVIMAIEEYFTFSEEDG